MIDPKDLLVEKKRAKRALNRALRAERKRAQLELKKEQRVLQRTLRTERKQAQRELKQALRAERKLSQPARKKAYCMDYYVRNRASLSKSRSERYATDDDYREKRQVAASLRAKILRENRIKRNGTTPSESRGYNRPRLLMVDGRETLVHCVSEFADRVGRNVQTITAWEQKGIIPSPTVVDEKRRRWYSEKHMLQIAEATQEYHRSGGRDLTAFKAIVRSSLKK